SFKCLDGILIESSRENNRGRVVHKLKHFKAVDLRHLNIQENKVRLMSCNRLDAFESIIALLDHFNIGVASKILQDDSPGEGFVVDKQSPDHAVWGILTLVINV